MDPIVEAFENGELLKDKYLCLGRINKGSYGIVYLSEDVNTGKKYAIKYVYPTPDSDYDDSKEEASKEIDIYLKLGAHPHVAQLIDYIDNFLVLEYCERGDLYDLIRYDEGPKTTKDIVDVMIQLIDLIQYCHDKGIYHRDIKPENIFVSQDCQMKLGDWGLATTERYSKQFNVGSDRYMAPELYLKEDDTEFKLSELDDDIPDDYYDASKVDIWALGICFLNIIFHKNPFNQANSRDKMFMNYCNNREILFDIFPSMSEDLFNVLRNCLNLDPKNRDLIKMKNELINVDTLTYQFNTYTDDEEEQDEKLVTDNNDSNTMNDAQSTSTKNTSSGYMYNNSVNDNFGKLSLVDPRNELTSDVVNDDDLQIDDLETALEEEDIKLNNDKTSTAICSDYDLAKSNSSNYNSVHYSVGNNNYDDDFAVGSYEEGPSSFITQPSKPINIKKSYQNHQDRKPLSIQTPNFKKFSKNNYNSNNNHSNFYKNSYVGNTVNHTNKHNGDNNTEGIHYRNSFSQSFKKFNKRDFHSNHNNKTNGSYKNYRKNSSDHNKRRSSNHNNNSSHSTNSFSNSRRLLRLTKPTSSEKSALVTNNISTSNNSKSGDNVSGSIPPPPIPNDLLSNTSTSLSSSLSKLDTKGSMKGSNSDIYIPPNLRDKLKSPANQAKAFTTDVYFNHLGSSSNDSSMEDSNDNSNGIWKFVEKNNIKKSDGDKDKFSEFSKSLNSTNGIYNGNGNANYISSESNVKNIPVRRRRASFGGKSMAPTLETIEDVYIPPHHRPNYDALRKATVLANSTNKFNNSSSSVSSKGKKNRNSGDFSSENNNKLRNKKHPNNNNNKFYSNGSMMNNNITDSNSNNNNNSKSNNDTSTDSSNSLGSSVIKEKQQHNQYKSSEEEQQQQSVSKNLNLPNSPNLRHSFDIRDISWADYDDEFDDDPQEMVTTFEFLKQRDELKNESKSSLSSNKYNNADNVFEDSSDEESAEEEGVRDSKVVNMSDIVRSKKEKHSPSTKKQRKNEKSNNYSTTSSSSSDYKNSNNGGRMSNKRYAKKRLSPDNNFRNNNYNENDSHKTFEKPYKNSNFEGLKKMLESINVQ